MAYIMLETEQFTLTTWEPTDSELKAAQYRASGYSAARAAALSGVGHRTVQRWDQKPEFKELVLRLRAEMMATLEPKLARLMEASAEVLIDVMEGRLQGDDPRALLARDISRDSSFRLLRARVAEQLRRGSYAPALEDAE